MFGYKARLEAMDGRHYWMIYRRRFWLSAWVERCNDEASCKRRLHELRNPSKTGWLEF